MSEYSREDIQKFLPFMANGSLAERDRKVVETWLQCDPLLREELADLYRLQDVFQHVESSSTGAGMAGLHRLLSKGAAEPGEADQQLVRRLPSFSLTTKKMQHVAALIIGILFIANFATWIHLNDRAGVELASSPETANLVIAFQPKVTEKMLRTVLLELDLQIVAGPSSLGLYRLYGEEPEAALHSLQEKTAVVESVTYANN